MDGVDVECVTLVEGDRGPATSHFCALTSSFVGPWMEEGDVDFVHCW
jgi:hypothetical protein